jgi:hypothetical protein
MVGDDVEADVGGVQPMGIRGVLVQTGKCRADWVTQAFVGILSWLLMFAPPASIGNVFLQDRSGSRIDFNRTIAINAIFSQLYMHD